MTAETCPTKAIRIWIPNEADDCAPEFSMVDCERRACPVCGPKLLLATIEPRVKSMVEHLDRIGAPVNMSRRKLRLWLRDNGHRQGFTNNTFMDVQRLRQQRANEGTTVAA